MKFEKLYKEYKACFEEKDYGTMSVVCAWCDKDLGKKKALRASDKDVITHGICPKCQKDMAKQIAALKK